MQPFSAYWLTAAAILGLSCENGGAPPAGDVAVRLELIAQGLDFPVDLAAPTGDSRLFIVEKTGKIRIVKDGAVLGTPFLDLSSLVSRGGEQGLLGLAFHPHYPTTGIFVVDYTDRSGNTVVARYHVSSDPDVADPASANILLPVTQPYSNHNGGAVAFGPDGYLYISLGDEGRGGIPRITDRIGPTCWARCSALIRTMVFLTSFRPQIRMHRAPSSAGDLELRAAESLALQL